MIGPASLDEGWIDAELAAEFPELRLATAGVQCVPGRSVEGVRAQLRLLSDRMTGAKAIKLRSEPIPSAYRIFFRLIGLDPDQTPTPVEEAALHRLSGGHYHARGLVEDALLLALVETGVPVYAVDEATLDGPLGVRPARLGERLGEGEHADDLTPGRLVVADSSRTVAVLFGPVAARNEVTAASRRLRLMAVGVAGVPAIHVEEALFACAEALQTG